MPLSEHESILLALKSELELVEKGHYRQPLNWRPPLIFEDSPICLGAETGCEKGNCILKRFVPPERLESPAPCRHIPLNEKGETVDSLYRTGTHEELETALRRWLLAKIKELGG